MPRLTPEELAIRRRDKAEQERQIEAQRKILEEERRKAEEEQARIAEEERLKKAEQVRRHIELMTVQQALYDEVDKLNRKAPKERVSDYALKTVNQHIDDVKAFLTEDALLARIHRFEPAGDNPEYRDVALVLAEIAAALKRFPVSPSFDRRNRTSY